MCVTVRQHEQSDEYKGTNNIARRTLRQLLSPPREEYLADLARPWLRTCRHRRQLGPTSQLYCAPRRPCVVFRCERSEPAQWSKFAPNSGKSRHLSGQPHSGDYDRQNALGCCKT